MKRLFNIILLIILITPSSIRTINTRIKTKNQKNILGNYNSARNRREKRVVNIHNLTSLVYYKNMTNFPYLINFNLTLQNKDGYIDYKPHKKYYQNPNEDILNSSQKLIATIDQALNTFFKQHMASTTKTVTKPKSETGLNTTTFNDSKNGFIEEDYFETDFNNTFSMYDDPGGISMDFFDNASLEWYDDMHVNLSRPFDEEQSPNPYGSYTLGQYVIIIILTVLLSTITILGNLLVLFSFVIERTLRQATNYYIVSLAVSDLIIGMISMPFYTLYLLLGSWPLGELLCDLWLSIDYTVCLASQYTVFFITLDRYCSVKIPASYRQWRTAFKVKFMIYCAWAIPIGIFFSAIIGWQYIFKSRGVEPNQCYVPFRDNRVFNTSLIFFYYWSTLVVLVSLYAGIYKVAYDLSKKSIEKEKRARAIVEHAVLTRNELKRTGKDVKAETIKIGEKANTLSILKHRKGLPDETTSFSRDDPTKEKEKSSSVSFPSDTDSQNENSYTEMPRKIELNKKNAAKQKSKDEVKSSNKKKDISPKSKHNNKNQYALNHLEPIRLLASKESLETLQKNEETDKSVTIIKDAQDMKVDQLNEDITKEYNEPALADDDLHDKDDNKHANDTFQKNEDKEQQLNKLLNNVKSFNIRITTNTPVIPDGDEFLDDDLEIYQATDVPLISQKTSTNQINVDRKSLILKGLKDRQNFPSVDKVKGNLTSSFSFQSTATTLTPLTPYPDEGTNITKESTLSSSLSPTTAGESCKNIVDTRNDGKNDRKKSEIDLKNKIKSNINGNNIRHNSIISNIVSFGKRNSKDKNKYNRGSASAGDEAYKGKQDAVLSGDKSSTDSKGNKMSNADIGKRRKSLSIIIKFKKKRKPSSERKKSKSENRARKALRTITCIMGAFVLCWTPYHICETIRGFNPDFPLNEHFYSFTYWLCYLNSPLNPFMYALANQQFKKTFIRIFKCDLHKN